MTYPEAVAYLQGLGRFGVRPGLETSLALAELWGHPEKSLTFLHVAGTNGKGSTCAFLKSICREAGLRVGLYTSPHLVSFRERIQVNGEMIPQSAVSAWVEDAQAKLTGGRGWGDVHPTFFEMVTVLALDWFARQRCEVVVWETGLGGRLDATNIVRPAVSAITNVGWDHMEWLGNTLPAIALEKAGIIKAGVPVVTTAVEPEVLEVLRRVASERGADLTVVRPDAVEWARYLVGRLALKGPHQRWNAALAVAALKRSPLSPRIDDGAMLRGLEGARWSGRFEVRERAGRTVVLDGAHNGPGFAALEASMAVEFPGRRFGLLLGMLSDKDPSYVLERLLPTASRVVVAPVASSRAADSEDLARRCRAAIAGLQVETASSVGEALQRLGSEELVLVTGSLYLVGEVLEILGDSVANERILNDWNAAR